MSELPEDFQKKTVRISDDARTRLTKLGIDPVKVAKESGIFRIAPAEQPRAWVVNIEGYEIELKVKFTIGRESQNDYPIYEPQVSRRHAMIVREQNHEFWIMDLGSANGTYVNEKAVQKPLKLCNGDQILIGNHLLIFKKSLPKS